MKAGFGKSVITPKVGTSLVGYANRTSPSVGVNDNLHARALALEANGKSWALCAVELCYFREPQVAALRKVVEERTGIPGNSVFICTVHTHSGPDDQDTGGWDHPLVELIAQAVVQATENLQPARIGASFGFLHGCSINRRWLDRPVDPVVGVIRVDTEDGHPLGFMTSFGCHAVVLGYDNVMISADWPGVTSRELETMMGPGAVCIVTQGGSGDVNPLTRDVRARLDSGIPVMTMNNRVYYGDLGGSSAWHIGDRGGGTYNEAEELGKSVAQEVARVAKAIVPLAANGVWRERISLDGSRLPDDPPYPTHSSPPPHTIERPAPPDQTGRRPMEIMMLGVEETGFVLIGEPGEIFAETTVEMRRQLQSLGYSYPWVIGYANGWQLYLPPALAYPEGGYEVDWAVELGLSPTLQNRIWTSVLPVLEKHIPH